MPRVDPSLLGLIHAGAERSGIDSILSAALGLLVRRDSYQRQLRLRRALITVDPLTSDSSG